MNDEASARSIFDPDQSLESLTEKLLSTRPEIQPETPWALCLLASGQQAAPLVLLRGQSCRPMDARRCSKCSISSTLPPIPAHPPCQPTTLVPIGTPTRGALGFHGPRRQGRAIHARLEATAQVMKDLLRRRELTERFRQQFGRAPWLLGTSPELHRLDEFLEKAAGTTLSVLLSGEPGSGKTDISRLLHLLSDRGNRPFVHLDVSVLPNGTWEEEVRRSFRRARGGTTYLDSVNSMELHLQLRLAQLLASESPKTRVIASIHRPIPATGSGDHLHPALWSDLAFLTFHLPPLRKRPDDIVPLARHFLHRHGRPLEEIPPPVGEVLRLYAWPGNVPELHHAMARLAAFGQGSELTLDEVRRHAAAILPQSSTTHPTPDSPGSLDDLVRRCGRGRLDTKVLPRNLHPALTRALGITAKLSKPPLSLTDLARNAHVSPSYLSQLFKEALGISPMAFVERVRIERSRQWLLAEPHTLVSTIASRAGFEELRTFERAFKRRTGLSPRDFRRHLTS